MLDTLEKIETPEGVSLSVRPAGLYVRTLAWFIDILIQAVAFVVIALVFLSVGIAFVGFGIIAAFVLKWFYNIIFEVWYGGATPGKRLVNLTVVYTNGAPVSLTGSVLRNFLRIVDSLPALYALGAAITLGNARFQRLGDMAAGTVVAYRDEAHVPAPAPASSIEDARPLRLALTRDEHKAIAQFGDRVDRLSPERREELAELLSPLNGLTGADAVAALRSHANWLSGRS